MVLKKPSEVIKSNLSEDYDPLSSSVSEILNEDSGNIFESFTAFKNNLNKINVLSDKIEQFSRELANKASKTDLENTILSQILVIDENFNKIKSQLNGINKRDLNEFKKVSSDIQEVVLNLINNDIPKYKKIVTNTEINLTDNFSSLQEKFFEFENQISEIVLNVVEEKNNILETVENIRKDVNKNHEKIGNEVVNIKTDLTIAQEHFKKISENTEELVSETISELTKKLNVHKYLIESEIEEIKNDVGLNEEKISKVDKYLHNHHLRLINLKEEVFSEIKKLPIGDFDNNIRQLEKKINRIEELYGTIDSEQLVEGVIKEGLLNISPNEKNSDPLTPLGKNFVTKQELEGHYKLFLNRIQQQLSTIGGGGETQLKYLDDIVGIATNPAAYDGKVLSYNHALRKFEFIVGGGGGNAAITISDTPPVNPSEGNLWYDSTIGRTFIYYVDADGSQWVDASPSGGIPQNVINTWIPTSVGIHTLTNVGIGTTAPTSTLTVNGDVLVTGVGTIGVSVPTQLKTKSVAEKTTIISGNIVELSFSSGGGNVAICTNPTGNITLNVISIPTDSSFDNHSVSFSVIVTQSGTARTCTAINLNGVSRTIRWSGGSLANAISGVTTSSGYDIFTFTGINTVGSASTTENYVILGSVNGGFN